MLADIEAADQARMRYRGGGAGLGEQPTASVSGTLRVDQLDRHIDLIRSMRSEDGAHAAESQFARHRPHADLRPAWLQRLERAARQRGHRRRISVKADSTSARSERIPGRQARAAAASPARATASALAQAAAVRWRRDSAPIHAGDARRAPAEAPSPQRVNAAIWLLLSWVNMVSISLMIGSASSPSSRRRLSSTLASRTAHGQLELYRRKTHQSGCSRQRR